jgi:transcriptional regulator with XRE-family HTH domain
MSQDDVQEVLRELDLMREEAAQLLGVSKRTVTRWCEGEEVPGPALAALKAWRALKDRGLAWKPDSISVLENDEDQIERQRQFAVRFSEMLDRVDARGGPIYPWKVDTWRSSATFGTSEVNFHRLANGGFSISSYRRSDRHPDLSQDMPLIEDAAYCIAKEYARFGARAEALTEMANYVRQHSDASVRNGPKLPTPKEAMEKKRSIERLSKKLEELASSASQGIACYAQYEEIERDMHAAGFFPLDEHVAAVARAFVYGERD